LLPPKDLQIMRTSSSPDSGTQRHDHALDVLERQAAGRVAELGALPALPLRLDRGVDLLVQALAAAHHDLRLEAHALADDVVREHALDRVRRVLVVAHQLARAVAQRAQRREQLRVGAGRLRDPVGGRAAEAGAA
jgi:hypothetical protein